MAKLSTETHQKNTNCPNTSKKCTTKCLELHFLLLFSEPTYNAHGYFNPILAILSELKFYYNKYIQVSTCFGFHFSKRSKLWVARFQHNITSDTGKVMNSLARQTEQTKPISTSLLWQKQAARWSTNDWLGRERREAVGWSGKNVHCRKKST